jgi:poly(3-hydroxybutyrate) depolymerase
MRSASSLLFLSASTLLLLASCDAGETGRPATGSGAAGTGSGAAGTTGAAGVGSGAAGTGAPGPGTAGDGAAGTGAPGPGTAGDGPAGTGGGVAGTNGGAAGTGGGVAGTGGGKAGTGGGAAGTGGSALVPKGPSSGCGKPMMAGDKPGSYVMRRAMVTGVTTTKPATAGASWTDRVYYLALPSNYDPAKPYPIIFGGGGCGGALNTNGSNGGYGILPANSPNAIQIGLSYVWAQGGGACFSENGADNPDLPYFDSVLKEIEDSYCVDKGKVFVGGYSSGGWLSYMLAFARGGVVRGISPAAGGLHPEASRPPDTKLPVAGLLLTGANDTANPATGPTGSDAARDLMLMYNGCQGTDTVPWETPCTGCGCVRYTGCPAAYPVVRCRPPGQGHTDGGGAFKTAVWATWMTLP